MTLRIRASRPNTAPAQAPASRRTARRLLSAGAAVLLALLSVPAAPTPASAQTSWTGSVGGATAYPDEFWNPGEPVAFGDYYSPFYWPEGQDIVHTLAFYYSGNVADVGIGFQIRGRAGTTFLTPARILDDANGACPSPAQFEYSVDGVTWSTEFVAGATFILYQTNTDMFINQSPRDGTPCLIGVLATADRPTTAQDTTNADLYRLMDATPDNVHDSSRYSLATTSESDFTQQAFTLTAGGSGTVSIGDTVTFTATMTSLKTGTPLTARSHEIDVSRLLDDADILPTITASSGSAELTDGTIVWSSDGSIPNGAVVTVTFQVTVTDGGDGDLRAAVNGPTTSASWPFNLHSGPRSNCQTVPREPNWSGQGDVVWASGQVLSAAEVAAMEPAEWASTLGACGVVLNLGTPVPTIIADAGGPYRIDEGSSLTLDATATQAGPTAEYDWDLDGEGDFDDATGPTPLLTAEHLAGLELGDGPAHRAITLRVTDEFGVDTAETTITVDNLPPSLTVAGPDRALAGAPTAVVLTATDPWPPDVVAPIYDVGWGDGSSQRITTSNPQRARHVYDRPGTYIVTATVTDKDGAVSAQARTTIVVDPALPNTGDGGIASRAAGIGLVLLIAGAALWQLARHWQTRVRRRLLREDPGPTA